jgi:hypothetical protein
MQESKQEPDDLKSDIGQFIDPYTIQSIRHFIGSIDARDMFAFYRQTTPHLSDILDMVIRNIDQATYTYMQQNTNLVRDYFFKLVYNFSRDHSPYFTERFRLGRLLRFLKRFYNATLQEIGKIWNTDIEPLVEYYLDIIATAETLIWNRNHAILGSQGQSFEREHRQYKIHLHQRTLTLIEFLHKKIPPSELLVYKKELETEKRRLILILQRRTQTMSTYRRTRLSEQIQQIDSDIRVLEEWMSPYQDFIRSQIENLAVNRDYEPNITPIMEEMQGVRPARHRSRQKRQSSPSVMELSEQQELNDLVNMFERERLQRSRRKSA